MPFNAFARHRPSRKAYHRRNSIPWLAMASDCRRTTDECELPPLDIGVRAMQLSPYRTGVAGPYHTRLLLRPAFRPCSCPLALSGPGQAVASKSSALNFGLLWRRFIPCVTWRTVSLHSAQASRRPCERPVSSHRTCWLHDTTQTSMPLCGEGSTGAIQPPSFATPSVSIPP